MPRRILFLITDLQIGGTPTVVRELALRLRAPGTVHIEVACLSPWGPVAKELAAAGVPVTSFDARTPADLPRTVHRLNQLLRSHRIDTCFSFLLHANAVASLSSLFNRDVRYFQSVQTTQPHPRWHWGVTRWVHPAAERVIVPSVSISHALQAWSRVPGEKIVVIPNAVDVEAFSHIPRRPSVNGRYRVGFIGRLDPVKRIPDLVRAMALLPSDVELHIYGEGPDRARIEGGDRVVLHGAVARPQDALGEMDVLVLPSEAEGFGLVLIEAMAAGVPVVATDAPGIRDVVTDHRSGVLVPVGSPEGLARGIEEVRGNAGVREGIVAGGRREVSERFSWGRVLGEYRRVLGIGEM